MTLPRRFDLFALNATGGTGPDLWTGTADPDTYKGGDGNDLI